MLPRVRVVSIFLTHVGFPRSLWLGTIFFTSFLLCGFPIWASKWTRLTNDPKISPWISTVCGTCWWSSVAKKAHVAPRVLCKGGGSWQQWVWAPLVREQPEWGAVKKEGSVESRCTGAFGPLQQKWGLLARVLILYFLNDLLLLFHH